MAIDPKGSGDLIVVSRLKQTDELTARDIAGVGGALIEFNEASGIEIAENREDNQAEKTGQVEATEIDILDRSAEGELSMDKVTPDYFAWATAMFCDDHTKANPEGSVWTHTSKIMSYAEHPAYFTVAHRKGGSGGAPAALRHHIGASINQFTVSGSKEEFVTAQASILGLGKFDDGLHNQVIGSVDLAAGPFTVTLDFNPDGASDAEMAANVTLWADDDGDGHYELELAAASYDGPDGGDSGVLTFTDPGTAGTSVNVRATYIVHEDEQPGHYVGNWRNDMEAVSVLTEFKMKSANTQLLIGVAPAISIPGTAALFGSKAGCEVGSFEYTGDWQGEAGKCWRSGATAIEHATSVNNGDMRQTLSLDRQVQDYLLQANFDANTPMSFYADAIGPIAGGTTEYRIRMYIPRMKFLEKPQTIEDGKWQDGAQFLILKDASNVTWPTVIFETTNLTENYHV